MRYNWFARLDDTSVEGISSLCKELDDKNYYSFLFTYHAYDSDNWIKAAHTIQKDHKIKYMIAIRPYAISPEYLVMMINAFEEISPNRLMINIICGLGTHEENIIDNLILNKEYFDNYATRQEYTRSFMKKVREILPKDSKVEFVLSALQDYDIETSNMYSDCNVMFYSDFIKNHNKVKSKVNMVAIMPIIRDTHQEAKEQYDSMIKKGIQMDTIYGTESEIIDQINNLEKMGATDILVNAHKINPHSYRVRLLMDNLASQTKLPHSNQPDAIIIR